MRLKQKTSVVLPVLVLLFASFPLFAAGEKQDAAAGTPARKKISVTVYDRGNVPAAEGTIENNRWTRWINENGPVDVTFVAIPRVRPEDKINTLFASGTAPDLVLEYYQGTKVTLYEQGLLMPLDDLIEKHSITYKAFLAQNPGVRKAALMSDGKMYQFGKSNLIVPNRDVLIRADWLEKLGLEIPETTDDLYNVAKAFAEQDPDGNGIKDTYGIVVSYRARESIQQMFQTFSPWVVKNDEVVYGWDRLRYRLEFQKKLYDEGIIDRDFLNDVNGSKAMQDFVNGKVGILPWLIGWQNFTTKEYATLKKNVPTAKLAVMPNPKTPWGRFNPTMEAPIQVTGVVNADCKDPQAVMQYVDFISGEQAYLALQYGIEGVHYNFGIDGKPVTIDADKRVREVSWAGDFQMLIPYSVKEKFLSDTDNFNLNDPIQKEGYSLYKDALRIYLDTSVPYAELTHSSFMPILPTDLSVINTNINLNDILDKAVVSGSSYSVDEAIRDAQAAWEKGGGKQIEGFFRAWYKNERQNAFLINDIYEVIKQQDHLHRIR
jgi:putative aldouronate transport system substrate-binding protein